MAKPVPKPKPGASASDKAAAEIAAKYGYVPGDPSSYTVDDNWEILLQTIPGRPAQTTAASKNVHGIEGYLGGRTLAATKDKNLTKMRNDLFDALYSDETFQKEVGISVAELQQRMFLAGFYGNASWEDVIPGQPDALTTRAFDQLLDISGRAFKVGSPATLLQVLDKFMGAGIAAGRGLSSAGKAKARPAVALPGPEEIAQAVRSTVSNLLGREPDQGELDSLAKVLTGFSTDAATAQQDLAVAPDGTQQVIGDPKSQFVEYLTSKYKPEITRNQDVKGLSTGRDNLLKTVLSLDKVMGR